MLRDTVLSGNELGIPVFSPLVFGSLGLKNILFLLCKSWKTDKCHSSRFLVNYTKNSLFCFSSTTAMILIYRVVFELILFFYSATTFLSLTPLAWSKLDGKCSGVPQVRALHEIIRCPRNAVRKVADGNQRDLICSLLRILSAFVRTRSWYVIPYLKSKPQERLALEYTYLSKLKTALDRFQNYRAECQLVCTISRCNVAHDRPANHSGQHSQSLDILGNVSTVRNTIWLQSCNIPVERTNFFWRCDNRRRQTTMHY